MKVFQVILAGYFGGTDDTDHLVVWIDADNEEQLRVILDTLQVAYTSVEEIEVDPDTVDFTGAVLSLRKLAASVHLADLHRGAPK